MNSLLYKLWRWSWIGLLPLLAAFIFLAVNTGQRYLSVSINQLGSKYISSISLYETGKMEFRYLLHNLDLDIRRALGLLPADELENLSLFVSEADLAQLDADLPASGFRYVPGLLDYNGKLRRIKLRYRGDFHNHWSFYKKSLRIKTKKDQPFAGMRKFNLIVPKTAAQFSNYLSYAVASALGLPVPENELVTATINGKYQGLYLLAEQIDETTLRKERLLPGDIYSGDQIYGNRLWYGIYPSLFNHPGLWEKSATNNHYPATHNYPLKKLLTTLKQPHSEAKQKALEKLIDLEAFARFNVLELFLNSHHQDTQHNWKLYFDPGTGKFRPLVWDPLGWYDAWLPGGEQSTWRDDDQPPLYVTANTLTHVLHKNGNFVRKRASVIEDFFRENKHTELMQLLQKTRQKLKPVIEKDPAMLTSQLKLITATEADVAMQKIADVSNRIFAALEEAYTVSNPGGYYQSLSGSQFGVQFTSHQPVQQLRFNLNKEIQARPDSIKVMIHYWDRDGEHSRDVSHHVTTHDGLTLKLPLIADFQWVDGSSIYNDFIRIAPGYYQIGIEGLPSDTLVQGVAASWNSVSFHPLTQRIDLDKRSFSLMTRVLPDDHLEAPLRWEGEIQLSETTRIARELFISAGTRISLAPGVSLFVENQLHIEGTTKQPVVLVASEPDKEPWGALVLEGKRASGSTLDNFNMSGGSGYRDDLREYSGMLSIHDVENVSLTNCLLKDNHLVDDMLHVVYSSILIDNCHFLNAKFDALDSDMSDLQLTNSQFTRSGNDGVDLMGSFAYVSQNDISDSGDKAVSVGERSLLYMTDNQLIANHIGIEAKDDSIALILDNALHGNQQALSGYMKNWRYGKGGRLIVCENDFKDNRMFITLDKKSHTWISRLPVPEVSIATSDRRRITQNCDILSGPGQQGEQRTIDYKSLDEDNYLPLLHRLYKKLPELGY